MFSTFSLLIIGASAVRQVQHGIASRRWITAADVSSATTLKSVNIFKAFISFGFVSGRSADDDGRRDRKALVI